MYNWGCGSGGVKIRVWTLVSRAQREAEGGMRNIRGERIWAEKAVCKWTTQRLPGRVAWSAKV